MRLLFVIWATLAARWSVHGETLGSDSSSYHWIPEYPSASESYYPGSESYYPGSESYYPGSDQPNSVTPYPDEIIYYNPDTDADDFSNDMPSYQPANINQAEVMTNANTLAGAITKYLNSLLNIHENDNLSWSAPNRGQAHAELKDTPRPSRHLSLTDLNVTCEKLCRKSRTFADDSNEIAHDDGDTTKHCNCGRFPYRERRQTRSSRQESQWGANDRNIKRTMDAIFGNKHNAAIQAWLQRSEALSLYNQELRDYRHGNRWAANGGRHRRQTRVDKAYNGVAQPSSGTRYSGSVSTNYGAPGEDSAA